MNKEAMFYARELEEAWKNSDIVAMYKLLSQMQNDVEFRVGSLIFRLSDALEEECDLMRRSIDQQTEFALIKNRQGVVVIQGGKSSFSLDEVAGVLYDTASPDQPVVFSHTHWDIKKHPMPGYLEVGFGDIGCFNILKGQYPQLECRAVFNDGLSVRAITYQGRAEL